MSTLADVLTLTRTFAVTQDPSDYRAWSEAYEALTKEEEEQVSGGCPDLVGAY